MPIDHPYLKRLKSAILSLNKSEIIKDDHPSLQNMCVVLEDVFRHGLTTYSLDYSLDKPQRSYWPLLKHIDHALSLPVRSKSCIDYTSDCNKILTNIGRERCFLRCCLNKGVIANFWRLVKSDHESVIIYYSKNALLVDEILSEIFLSMLATLEQYRFNLNYKNCSFLDETWTLPVYKMFELVPCDRLGIHLESINSRLIVSKVVPGSLAEEDNRIEPGDVVDELFGESMRNSTIKKFRSLFKDFAGSPVYVSVVKCFSNNGTIFPPIVDLLDKIGLDKAKLICDHNQRTAEILNEKIDSLKVLKTSLKCLSSNSYYQPVVINDMFQFPVSLCGTTVVGKSDFTDQIEAGIGSIMKSTKGDDFKSVVIDMGEKDLVVFDQETRKILFRHSYPKISACGRRIDYPLNIAFVAGETTCTLAKEFTCFVFCATCEEQAAKILNEISKGFDRTHWTV